MVQLYFDCTILYHLIVSNTTGISQLKIVNVFCLSITNKMQRYTIFYIIVNALGPGVA